MRRSWQRPEGSGRQRFADGIHRTPAGAAGLRQRAGISGRYPGSHDTGPCCSIGRLTRRGDRDLQLLRHEHRQSVISLTHQESPAHNRAMDKQRDLLPWIIGGVSVACVAVALTVSSTRLAPNRSPAPHATTTGPLPAATAAAAPTFGSASVPTPGPAPASASAPASAPISAPPLAPAPPATAPAGAQIWECTTNGQRTFSDNPCGSKSTLRELSSVNIMNPTPAAPPTRSFEPESEYAPEYSYPNPPQESANGAYPVYMGVPYRNHRRPDHTHRPYHPNHGPSPRKT